MVWLYQIAINLYLTFTWVLHSQNPASKRIPCFNPSAGKENLISKIIISILGIVGEIEKVLIKERQFEDVKIAKFNGTYKGRAIGSKKDTLQF